MPRVLVWALEQNRGMTHVRELQDIPLQAYARSHKLQSAGRHPHTDANVTAQGGRYRQQSSHGALGRRKSARAEVSRSDGQAVGDHRRSR